MLYDVVTAHSRWCLCTTTHEFEKFVQPWTYKTQRPTYNPVSAPWLKWPNCKKRKKKHKIHIVVRILFLSLTFPFECDLPIFLAGDKRTGKLSKKAQTKKETKHKVYTHRHGHTS
ncbi:uncharacterized protein CYBJADRAFT_24474 [Cyberlindnera jadinii NRRL Y-1542]|uniref:Uncharacterized protein n=1 Tax=Cyberlindnera jadinii (strain ATCC 18201 / CBS 1600 / BCRC 20928 / JCM 3617 / NBRC 0987 / NRRL Y-1542) TaxID=983966 RepID=A0A1E4RYT0_CYBJN|nr:hypothetical protein CYBJADRAFT_24474 [Cyberlindnera jadinii NRRL Y-1542]ODV72245.1 hypothetical protein CYBJADRAFT_24474 [Cyberlindnera jadinii NRRL Y-1542]